MIVMKKIYALLMFVMSAFMIAACSDSDDGTAMENGMIGNWYCVEDGTIYTVEFNKNGTGAMAIYTLESMSTLAGFYIGWKAEGATLQYTLVENLLTVKPINSNEVITAVVGITGNSMSLTDGDTAMMFTRYDGSEGKINELKKEVEDNWTELEPDDSHQEEVFEPTEDHIQTVIYGIYGNLRDYEYKQMLLEKIRLTGKDFYDRPASPITPSDGRVSDAWEAAYRTISSANMVIDILETMEGSNIEEYKRAAYINEAKALRCLVYYNLSQLWGSVPYVTIPDDPDNHDEIQQSPIYSTQTLCSELDGILQNIDFLPEGERCITMEAVKALRAEVLLSLDHKEEAAYILQDCQPDFYIAVDEQATPEIYRVFGGKIPNYTFEKTALLLKEAQAGTNEDKAALSAEWKAKGQDWGYWLMLKRTGQAQTVSGCKEHEILMPVPQFVVDQFPMQQNPGY